MSYGQVFALQLHRPKITKLCVLTMPIAVLPIITENKAKAGQKSMETMKDSTCKEQIK